MRVLLAVLPVALATVTVLGQERPNLSGRWMLEPGGDELVVTHDATALSFQYTSEGKNHSFNYRLDGTETRNSIPSNSGPIVMLARAEWVGATIRITETSAYPDGRKAHSTQLWWLDAQGRLILELIETFEGHEPTRATVTRRRINRVGRHE